MAKGTSGHLDPTDRRILEELQRDGRITLTELGHRVALSAPAVTERLRRLEARGVITGYAARLDPEALGYGLLAFVRVSFGTVPSVSSSSRRFEEAIVDLPEALECHHVTGEDCFLVKVAARDAKHLEELIGYLATFGRTTSSIVLSSPVTHRSLVPVEGAEAQR